MAPISASSLNYQAWMQSASSSPLWSTPSSNSEDLRSILAQALRIADEAMAKTALDKANGSEENSAQ